MTTIIYDIITIFDQSGSMAHMGNEPLEALNNFVTEQKESSVDTATFTLWQFNHEISLKIDDLPIKEVGIITDYKPSGMTALFDAIGNAIQTKMQKSKKDYVICVIITDGVENSSKEFTGKSQIQQLIKNAEEKHHWKFVYLGANQDAFSVGENMGIYRSCCAQFEPVDGGLLRVTRAVSQNVASYRQASSQGFQVDDNLAAGVPITPNPQPPYLMRQSLTVPHLIDQAYPHGGAPPMEPPALPQRQHSVRPLPRQTSNA